MPRIAEGAEAPPCYRFPLLPGDPNPPEWTGSGFRLGTATVRVLRYRPAISAWSDNLTAFREDITGQEHPIDAASRDYALREVRRRVARHRPTVLDIGCLTGYLVKEARRAMPSALVMGADFLDEPLETLALSLPGVPLLQFDLKDCPLPDDSLDAVFLLNVLEHIDDDRLALAQIARVLRPGGVAVVEVPAGPHLYDFYDSFWMHHRRYRLAELEELVRAAGLEVLRGAHIGVLVYPAFWLVKKLHRLRPPDERSRASIVMRSNAGSSHSVLLRVAMALEQRLRGLVGRLPGIRCVVTARKPGRKEE